jgi:hypothetical protein
VPILVSRGEFIAFGCGLNHAPQVLGGFNMRGEEMWQQNLQESYIAPAFAFAPHAGRFALSRLLTHSSVVQTSDILMPELVAGQAIVVYQTDTGRQLLRIEATPVARAGQNFSLSPDGLTLAVIKTNAIEVYALPQLTPQDRDAVKLAESSAPQNDGATAGLFDSPIPRSDARKRLPAASQQPPPVPEAQPSAPAVTSPAGSDAPAQPEDQTPPANAPRKPPTLGPESHPTSAPPNQ